MPTSGREVGGRPTRFSVRSMLRSRRKFPLIFGTKCTSPMTSDPRWVDLWPLPPEERAHELENSLRDRNLLVCRQLFGG
jgi:hypothetical protein